MCVFFYCTKFLCRTEREAADDLDLGGYSVKKGIHIIIPTCAIHTDPELWPDPMKFDPER